MLLSVMDSSCAIAAFGPTALIPSTAKSGAMTVEAEVVEAVYPLG